MIRNGSAAMGRLDKFLPHQAKRRQVEGCRTRLHETGISRQDENLQYWYYQSPPSSVLFNAATLIRPVPPSYRLPPLATLTSLHPSLKA